MEVADFCLIVMVLPFPVVLVNVRVRIRAAFGKVADVIGVNASVDADYGQVGLLGESFRLRREPDDMGRLFYPAGHDKLLFADGDIRYLHREYQVFHTVERDKDVFLADGLLPGSAVFLSEERQTAHKAVKQ